MIWRRITSWLHRARAAAGASTSLSSIAATFGVGPDSCSTDAQHRTAFTIAFVALAAKMAKADGVAVIAETNAFERWFHVPDDQREAVRRVFDLAKRDVAGYEAYAEQIAKLLQHEPDLKRDIFECLFHVASADGVLHEAEEGFLIRVARILGIGDDGYADVRHMFVVDPDDPYTVLGVPRDISDADLKTRYRRLAMDNHSDRLAAHGVPREFQIVADRKLAAINGAYDAIVKMRKRQRESAGSAA